MNTRSFGICLTIIPLLLFQCTGTREHPPKPRILVSTDIGGTDPDDFQSMIHLLMYADQFRVEGLVSSPYGPGRKTDILDMIDLYEKDLPKLRKQSSGFPDPDNLRAVCKQGAVEAAPFKGFDQPTEGSDWLIRCALQSDERPLWVLVWGGLEDLAQALHDAPEIKERIRVYWIGGPNKKWSVNAYAYIAQNHPDLWMIEANATYRGWFMDDDSDPTLSNKAYFQNHIRSRGAMGDAFRKYYDGEIKMGDTPSLAYLMDGDPDDPSGKSWGGSFSKIDRSSRRIFNGNSTIEDTVAAYAVLAWRFEGPGMDIPADSSCFTLEIQNQVWPGYYLGAGIYGVRYSPKRPETGSFTTSSDIPDLDGLTGQYVSINPWPGKPSPDDYVLGINWYGDKKDPELFIREQQGAKTVSRYRKEFLLDWAQRWQWLNE